MKSFQFVFENFIRGTGRWRHARVVVALLVAFLVVVVIFANGGPLGTLMALARMVITSDRSQYQTVMLTDARRGFQTQLVRRETAQEPVQPAPAGVFEVVKFRSKVGDLAAYLTPDPGDGKRHPAIVWITGGDCNTIGPVWEDADPRDDQTARAFREAGIVMMFPSLRGGNVNPGFKEGFFGEVDDVLSATDFLARQTYVDPKRIYLGGHSTGGTLVFLVAASSDRYRAVFSFGPVDLVRFYPTQFLPFNTNNSKELALRSPLYWLHSVLSPTFVFEGTDGTSNINCLYAMKRDSSNARIHFHPVKGTDHFSILAPTTRTIASQVLRDTGATMGIQFTDAELAQSRGR